MSTDSTSDADSGTTATDADPSFVPHAGERDTEDIAPSDSGSTHEDDYSRTAWKRRCPRCEGLIPATARSCPECRLVFPGMKMREYYAEVDDGE